METFSINFIETSNDQINSSGKKLCLQNWGYFLDIMLPSYLTVTWKSPNLLRLCAMQKSLQLSPSKFSFSSVFLDGAIKPIRMFLTYFCFRHIWPMLDLLTCYAMFFPAMSFIEKQ